MVQSKEALKKAAKLLEKKNGRKRRNPFARTLKVKVRTRR